MSLTTRLFLLIVVALLPAIAIQTYNGLAFRHSRAAEAEDLALQQAQLASSEIDRIMEGVRQLLTAVARTPAAIGPGHEQCDAYLTRLQPDVPYLTAIWVEDFQDGTHCGTAPLRRASGGLLSIVKAQDALQSLAIGVFQPADGGLGANLPVAVPVRSGDGRTIGAAIATLDLDWLTTQLRIRGYPAGGSITVADHDGTILAREPTPAKFIGTRIPDAFHSLLNAPKPGVTQVESQDGTRRVLGYVPLAPPFRNLYVSAGLSTEEVFAAADASERRGISANLAGLLLALALAAFVGRSFIKSPVDRMLATAKAWRAGDTAATTGLSARHGELGQLGAEFDRVVAEVRERSEAMRDSESRFRLAVETTGIGIWDVDGATGLRRWSAEFIAIMGLPADTPTTTEVFSRQIHPEDRERVTETYARAYAASGGGVYDAEFRIYRADDGALCWVSTNGRTTFDPTGRPIRAIGTLRDTTERRRGETALRESEAMLRALADNLPNGMVFQLEAPEAGARQFRYISEGVIRLFGVSAEEAKADASLLYERIVAEDRDAVAAAEAEALMTGSLFNLDVRIRRADGSARWFQLSSAPRTLADASVVWDGVAIDVTALKDAQGALRKLNETLEGRVAERTEELAESNRRLLTQIAERERVEATLSQMQRLEAVGQLTSGVAHDFNNLLTVIIGNLGFLERTLSTPADKRRIEMMRIAAERGAKLTHQLLSFSRRQRLQPSVLDLNDTVSEMRDLLESTIGGGVQLEIRLSPDPWLAVVDPTQVELVILNLAINARDAMGVGGTLAVETANELLTAAPSRPEHPAPGEYVAIRVSDTGTGMSEDILAKVFEPFFTTKDVGKGSGLGLAQVYGFAKQSGGGVRIATEVGLGSTVSVYLPRAAAGESTSAANAPDDPSATSRISAHGTILVVDDDRQVREVTTALLQDLGYEVAEADGGAAGLRLLDGRKEVDLLLVDFAMPGMNGAEFAESARRKRPDVPILFITGYADYGAIRELGAERVIQKPFRAQDLSSNIEHVLALRACTARH